jgi:hypothetical protein
MNAWSCTFCNVTPYGLVEVYGHFVGTGSNSKSSRKLLSLLLAGCLVYFLTLKMGVLCTSKTSQKIFLVTAMRASNPAAEVVNLSARYIRMRYPQDVDKFNFSFF